MAFSSNVRNIERAVEEARDAGGRYLLTPELSICGYGCEDHFFESDTETHCWEALAKLATAQAGASKGFLLDVGMPVYHGGSRYNCRVIVGNGEVLGIRPKTVMADDGNYREGRWFTAWPADKLEIDSFLLPPSYTEGFSSTDRQRTAPFGLMSFLSVDGLKMSVETCEELWSPRSPNVDASLSGVDVIANGSGSHHELRKLQRRLELVVEATKRSGGIYLYSNQVRVCVREEGGYGGGVDRFTTSNKYPSHCFNCKT